MEKERVDYKDIEGQVNQLKKLASDMNNTTDDIKIQINKIGDSWEGLAASSFIREISKLCDNLPEAIRQMAEAIVFLAGCSDSFENIEGETLQQLQELIGADYMNNYDSNQSNNIDLNRRLSHNEVVQRRNTSSETTIPEENIKIINMT